MRTLAGVCLSALLLLAAAAPVPARAQEDGAAALEERVDVRLHLVDVVALDRDGRALRGLTREHFEVRVDGERREIATLDAAPAGPEEAAARGATAGAAGAGDPPAAREPAAEPRFVAIVFDADRIAPESREKATRLGRRLLAQAAPGDRYAVALLRGGSLEYVQTFRPAGEIPAALLDDPGRIASSVPSMTERLAELTQAVERCRSARHVGDCAVIGSAEFRAVLQRESAAAVAALRDLVAALSPLPGRKALLLFSDGFVNQPGEIALEALSRVSEDAAASVRSRMIDMADWEYESLLTDASRARVTLFTIRTGPNLALAMTGAEHRGSASERDRATANPYSLAAQVMDGSLRRAAEATGGRAVTGVSGDDLPPLVRQLEGVYTLGIPVREGDTVRSRVDVRLARGAPRGARIVAPSRLGYRGRLPAAIAGGLVFEPPVARVRVELASLAVDEVEDGAKESRVAVYVRVLDAETRALVADDYVVLAVPRGEGPARQLEHALPLALGPGRYVLSAAVADLVGHGRGAFEITATLEAQR